MDAARRCVQVMQSGFWLPGPITVGQKGTTKIWMTNILQESVLPNMHRFVQDTNKT